MKTTKAVLALPAVLVASLALVPFVRTVVVEAAWLLIVPIEIALGRAYGDAPSTGRTRQPSV